MNREALDTQDQNPPKKKKSIGKLEIIVIAVLLLLVVLLLFMGKRTCSVTLPSDMYEDAQWVEVTHGEGMITKTEEGYTSETEYTFTYKAAANRASVVVIYAYRDRETGDEMAERVAYEFTTNAFGFISAKQVELPKDTEADIPTE